MDQDRIPYRFGASLRFDSRGSTMSQMSRPQFHPSALPALSASLFAAIDQILHGMLFYRAAPGTNQSGPSTSAQRFPSAILTAAFLALLVAGPWLGEGYIFGTDWPGPRRFLFPHEASSTALLRSGIAGLSLIFSGQVAGKLLILGFLFVGAMTAYRAIPTGGFVARAAGATVYVVNPFVYGRLQYGQLFLLAGYSILPWVAVRFRVLLQDPRTLNAVMAAASMTLLGMLSLHLVLVATVLGLTLLVAHVATASAKQSYLKQVGPTLVLAIGVTLVASAYWAIPILVGRGPEGSTIAGIGVGDLSAFASVSDPSLGLLPNLLGLYGFWAEDSGRFASMKDFVPLWPVALSMLLLVAGLGAATAFRSKRDRLAPVAAGFIAAAAIALILEAGVSSPLTSPLVMWLDTHVSLYRGMRDAGKWGALLALAYSQLIGMGATVVLDWIRARRIGGAPRQWLHNTAVGVLLALPLYYGNGLLYGTHGEIVPSEYPKGWYEADQALIADHHPDRTLFLPWHSYMELSFVHNQNSVVASPAPYFFSTPVLTSSDLEVAGIPPPTDPEQKAISDLVAAGSHGQWAQVLGAHHVKYILLAREFDWNSYTYLDSQFGLVRVGDYASIVLYRNTLVA